MNLLRLSFLLVLAISISACNNDDDEPNVCTQTDWVGTYEGTADCDGTQEDVTVTITANGSDAIDIIYVTATLTTEYELITPNGCNVNSTATGGGFTATVDATLDGDDLDISEEISAGGVTTNCTVTATRN